MVDTDISTLTSIQTVHANPLRDYVAPGKIFELPGFQMVSILRDGADQNVLHVSFSYDVVDRDTNQLCKSDCRLEFDLGMHCLPTKLDQSYKCGFREIIHKWYQKWTRMEEGSYRVEQFTETKTVVDAALNHLLRIKSERNISTSNLPETDFTLSAFGFPEPPGVEWKKPFPWYLVAAAAGTICLGVFFFLRARARRLKG